ncbi:hypothetical protein ACJIZ3_004052 [Penstemon smallii]|uniref:Growth-regulating factor n=1 Tax=Penstemon smallii TaxID=265156 RepID=A0ABD3S135_9LAMI
MEAYSPPSKISRISEHGKLASSPSLNHAGGTGFTFMQRQELEHQSLIYTYMEAGIPIPSYLIFPIWKCFADHQYYPNLLGYNALYCGVIKGSMDNEPGRCRRTDGKKWRCSKNVANPGQKYCHNHMHRGRHRPRNRAPPSTTTSHHATKKDNIDDISDATVFQFLSKHVTLGLSN